MIKSIFWKINVNLKKNADQEVNVSEKTGICTQTILVGQIYPTELQLNKANSSDTEAPFLDLNLSITNGIVSSKI